MPRIPLPPARRLPWPLKPLSSARTGLFYDEDGRIVMTIEHDLLHGLTPAMLAWWFRNIGGTMAVGDVVLPRYLVWHPTDHIMWALVAEGTGERVGVGSRFRIVEAFGADPANSIDVTETVTRLDESGITLVNTIAGLEVSRLNHDFIAADGGTLYRSQLTVGLSLPVLGRPLNSLILRAIFPEAKGRAWLKHNVEEVGLLEHIVPALLGGVRG